MRLALAAAFALGGRLERLFGGTAGTFHDACHLAHAQGIHSAPRQLLEAVAGERWTPLPESDLCCGNAGTYNLTKPEVARRLQERKLRNIFQTQAEVVVTTNPGCLLQIQSGLCVAGAAHIRVMHLADYLAQALKEAGAVAGANCVL